MLPKGIEAALLPTMPLTIQETKSNLCLPRTEGGLGLSKEDAATLVGVPGAVDYSTLAVQAALVCARSQAIAGSSNTVAGRAGDSDGLSDRVVKWVINESLGQWEEREIDVAGAVARDQGLDEHPKGADMAS